jgi:hypothetical protein
LTIGTNFGRKHSHKMLAPYSLLSGILTNFNVSGPDLMKIYMFGSQKYILFGLKFIQKSSGPKNKIF